MIDFDLRQLEYFVAAARLGSYSKAARELFVTPQAISHSIQLLEARIGDRLFTRTSNGITLTSLGSACLQPAQDALAALARLQGVAQAQGTPPLPAITLAIHSLCFRENGGSLDRTELLAFQKAHSKHAALSFFEATGSSIVDSLLRGTADYGVSVPPADLPGDLVAQPLKRFALAALVSKAFPGHFAQNDDRVTLEELGQGELVLFTDEQEYNGFLIERAEREGHKLAVSPMRISPHGDMGFLAGSQLFAIRPLQHALRTVDGADLRILPIYDCSGAQIQMPLAIIRKAECTPTKTEGELVAFIEKCYR